MCEDSDVDSEDEEVVSTKVIAAAQYAALMNFRYIFRASSYHADVRGRRMGYSMSEWKKIVLGYKYNEEEFLKIFRVLRQLFFSLVQLLKNHPAFGRHGKRQRKHFSVELHLLVLLKYMGAEGNGCSAINLKHGLGIGKGSVTNYLRRAVEAVLSLFSDTVFWPDDHEREEISQRLRQKNHFPKCVGAIDGTHLGLAFKPELDREEYWTRKQHYAVAATLVCDDLKRIRYINVGWPGSVHDQRVFQNSALSKNPSAYFSDREYLLGDSAYTPSPTMVPAYKKFGGQVVLAFGQVFFNDLLSSCHVKIEQTIGIWKGRFPFLRNIRVRIGSKKDMRFVIKLVKASAVLHNLFVEQHTVPKSWLSMDDLIDADWDDDLDEELYLSPTITVSGCPDTA
jgi:hypothetical protein